MDRVYKTFFSNSRLTFRRFGLKEPRLSETKERKCATSIVERVGALNILLHPHYRRVYVVLSTFTRTIPATRTI